MYPERELNQLAARKAVLRMRIGLRRIQCTEAAAGALRPLAWLDRAREFLARIQPVAMLAAVPVAILAGRSSSRFLRFLGPIVRLAPLLLGGSRVFG
jgi:hypothetical protein